jgi:hypothetical protein
MTTLVSWLGVDQRGPSSLYFASDSRFTWDSSTKWDYGRKLFASRSRPEILAYCGDVLFSSQVLGQALQLIDGELLYGASVAPTQRLASLQQFLQESFKHYPASQRRSFSVIYGARIGAGMGSTFYVGQIDWTPSNQWSTLDWQLPVKSSVISKLGTGYASFSDAFQRWQGSDVGGTSRAVYSAFCDHLKSNRDPASGGAPQLVGLYREGSAMTIGVVFGGERWISGACVKGRAGRDDVEWRDELFQRCDGNTLSPLVGAQRHARPRGV